MMDKFTSSTTKLPREVQKLKQQECIYELHREHKQFLPEFNEADDWDLYLEQIEREYWEDKIRKRIRLSKKD